MEATQINSFCWFFNEATERNDTCNRKNYRWGATKCSRFFSEGSLQKILWIRLKSWTAKKSMRKWCQETSLLMHSQLQHSAWGKMILLKSGTVSVVSVSSTDLVMKCDLSWSPWCSVIKYFYNSVVFLSLTADTSLAEFDKVPFTKGICYFFQLHETSVKRFIVIK